MKIVSNKLMGGLGNMMFQISAAYSLSLRDNKKYICDIREMVIPHKPYSEYISNILRKIPFSDKIENLVNYTENDFSYNEIPKIPENVRITGYFQSEKYFKNYRNEILDLFEIDVETKKILDEKYANILKEDTCSLHVRRGDYLGKPNHHPTQSINYYVESINIVGKEKLYLIFSDDLSWCYENLSFIKNKLIISDSVDYQDLYLMSMCKNNIIANSTFSWWGAWMNRNSTKKIISPKLWFGDYLPLNTQDLYCDNWIKI